MKQKILKMKFKIKSLRFKKESKCMTPNNKGGGCITFA